MNQIHKAITSSPAEEADQRAETARSIQAATGLSDALLEDIVRRFYDTARRDPLIGPIFDHVRDWDVHISRITLFWSSVAFGTKRYHGQPLPAHAPLGVREPHFARWLTLWEQTVRALCSEAGAAMLIDKAHRIANGMQFGLAIARGETPTHPPFRS